MFAPVGSKPPAVYWRRRLIVLGSVVLLIVLLVLTVRAVTSGGGAAAAASASSSSSAPKSTAVVAPPVTSSTPKPASSSVAPPTKSSSTGKAASSASSAASTPAPARCAAKALAVTAVVAKPSYKVGEHPVVELQVTNTGAVPCIQDLADKQIELKVYNGESRVWGSHDCEIQPGSQDRTLAVKRPVRVSMTWSGLTSAPGCTGTRQRVGAGTYTLYALLSGHTGKAVQFAFS